MSESGDSQANEVCIVDDDPSVLKSMHYLLASEGFKVRPFNKPEDFLAHASSHHVPVLVTDIWMDRVTGLEVLARLCAISPKTRVIVITAREDLAARATAMAIAVARAAKSSRAVMTITFVFGEIAQSRASNSKPVT